MTTDTTLLYYDPYDYDVEVDAQSIWKRLRDEAPVYWTRGSSSTRSASTTTCTGLTAADISARMFRETAINRRGKNRTQAQRAARQTTERTLDVDHAYPAARATLEKQPEKWLDAANLQFMFGDDNRWHKGDRYTK